jgi:TRAP-type C4-dicarboxylate transport system permease large subunit
VVSAVLKVPFGTVMRNIWFMVVPLLLAWGLVVALPWMSLALLPAK